MSMGMIGRQYVNPAIEKRSDDRMWNALLAYSPTLSKVSITESNAMTFSAVYAAVRVLAETVSSLPLIVYERSGFDRNRVPEHPVYKLMHDSPNKFMTSMVFRETEMIHVLLWGNCFAEIIRNYEGEIASLQLIEPWRVKVKLSKAGVLTYEVSMGTDEFGNTREPRYFSSQDIFHVPGLGFNGIVGRSVVSWARESFGLSLAAEQFGSSFFGKAARPSGVLEHPGHLDTPAANRLRESWQSTYGSSENTGKVAVLEEGMTFKPLTIPPEDAQFLETRKFQVEEVARWFRVPPHKIGYLERATFSNIEQQSIDFVVDSVRPWLIRFEQEINRKLLNENYFAEHLVDGLLRGDSKTRFETYAVGRQWGIYTPNDIRRAENLPLLPPEVGDILLVPLNMTPADRVNEVIDAQIAPKQLTAAPQQQNDQQVRSAHRMAIMEAVQRMISIETNAARKKLAKNRSGLTEWMDDFYPKHEKRMIEALTPVVNVYLASSGETRGVENVVSEVASKHSLESRAEFTRAADCDPGAWTSILDQLVSRWEIERANELTNAIMEV